MVISPTIYSTGLCEGDGYRRGGSDANVHYIELVVTVMVVEVVTVVEMEVKW